ncbi:MAG: cobalamin-binding protein [Acidimicrobiales bacterium]
MVRAVSLVPSATETVIELGARECLVGVSDDCLALKGSSGLPVISRAVLAGSSQRAVEIDAAVRSTLESGGRLYELDGDLLRCLSPDIIFAQDQCSVCAVPSSAVLEALGPRAAAGCRTVSIDPHDLEGVLRTFGVIADAIGLIGAGGELAERCRQQLRGLFERPARARVLVLDWTEPAFVAGNWVPELVAAAGGTAVGARPGEPSHTIDLADFMGQIDAVVVAPCGLSLEEAAAAARALVVRWPALRSARLCALDGRAWFSRPGPGLVEGTAALAAWLDAGILPAEIGVRIAT